MRESELIRRIAEALTTRGETIAVAESTTGGLISAGLLSVPGASAWYMGGTVIYTRVTRKLFLDVSAEQLSGIKPMSEEMAQFFAVAVRTRLESDWGIAELGIAGPSDSAYGVAAGNSVIAVSGPVDVAVSVNTGHNDRAQNMQDFTDHAFALLQEALQAATEAD